MAQIEIRVEVMVVYRDQIVCVKSRRVMSFDMRFKVDVDDVTVDFTSNSSDI